MHWDDLRYFLALKRHRKLVAAGRSLKVDHTTVGRRIKELESSLNTKLFERKGAGFVVTDAGKEIVGYAEEIEQKVFGIEGILSANNEIIKGLVRISAPEEFSVHFLATRLPGLLEQYSELEVDLFCDARDVNLPKCEIDITITSERPDSDGAVVKRLTDYTLGLFAGEKYFEDHEQISSPKDLRKHKLINGLSDQSVQAMIKNSALNHCKKIPFRSRSLVAQYKAAQNGYGLCLMPCFIEHEYGGLVRVLKDEIKITRTLWLVIHQDVRELSRIKKVTEFVVDNFYDNRSVFKVGMADRNLRSDKTAELIKESYS
jgi:DNA-binding transcriptional LysR family regulator